MDIQSERIHAFDNARAMLALLGIPFHVVFFLYANIILASTLTFHYSGPILLNDVPETNKIALFIVLYFHLFRMPAFFLLAGFFAHYLFQEKRLFYFFKNRALRIGLPFLIFIIW